jgi:hypothetical protein
MFMKFYSTLVILVLLRGAISIGRSEVSDKQLQDLVDKSTLTFIGTIKEMNNSNVSGFDSKDFPMIVQVEKVETGDQEALKKFGYLEGQNVTVAVNPFTRNGLRKGISVVFFAKPLIYETNIGMTADVVFVDDRNTKEDFLNKLHAAGLRKLEAPLRAEVANSELIIAGIVETVGHKAVDLRSLNNSWEYFSEHRPRWMEAIIKVQSVEKPKGTNLDFVSVVFPSTRDCFLGKSPKFEVNQSGIWLLHRNQGDEKERNILLRSEKYKGRDIGSYTALAPADFQDLANLGRIQEIIAETK